MNDLFYQHIYFYLPFGLSFIALYLKVVGTVYNFHVRKIGQIMSRLLCTVFLGLITYNINFLTNDWFGLMGLGILLLFSDEIIAYFFIQKDADLRKQQVSDCLKLLEEELKLSGVEAIHGKQ